MKSRFAVCFFLLALLLAIQGSQGCGAATGPEDRHRAAPATQEAVAPVLAAQLEEMPGRLDVPYVSTPEDVVDAMLNIAQVGKDDVLYDLGCGDGRIVVTAAKRMGTRGVGIDLDPVRIRESKENAKQANVTDRVEFLEQDLFETDISEATVLNLYLLPSVNLRLRPKIFDELKPGTRVVSHDFDMGEWKPDGMVEIAPHEVYFWVVPANASGTWEGTIQTANGATPCVLQMNQKYQRVEGTFTSDGPPTSIRDAKLVGDRLQFTVDENVDGQVTPVRFEGRVNSDSIAGTVTTDGRQKAGGEWEIRRSPGSAVPIDD